LPSDTMTGAGSSRISTYLWIIISDAPIAGLAIEDNGALRVDDTHETSMERVHACGDAARGGPQVAFAVGDGAYAGKALLERLIMGCDAARLALRVD